MTVILGAIDKGTIYMGSDSQVTYGNTKRIVKDLKVFKKGDMLFGVCGTPRIIQLLNFSLDIPEHPKRFTDYAYISSEFVDAVRCCFKTGGYSHIENNEEKGGDFLIAYHNRIYNIDYNFSVSAFEGECMAVGVGDESAIGAYMAFREMKLSVKESIRMAIEITCEVNICCSLPVVIKSLKYEKGK